MTTGTKQRSFIRPATLADASEIARLAGQLGYPSQTEEISTRLELLLGPPNQFVSVAAANQNEKDLLGWIAAEERYLLIAGRQVEITGLVVDDASRGRGVGQALVTTVERWAGGRGFYRVLVRSNVVRPESHPFYERLGYSRVKSQHVYLKEIA